ncbi:hypothetical protein OY671_005371 [Metschnikowia pulcherrima]|nr:hypothetical protein OY671_005371 [Metschnikowia pulcherrima]
MEKQSLLDETREVDYSTTWKSVIATTLSKPLQCLAPAISKSNKSASPENIESSVDAQIEGLIALEQPSDSEPLPELPFADCKVKSTISAEKKLVEIRKLMKKHGVSVYIVPSEDEHQSEETALADKRREYLSGFTGSAGLCVITIDDSEGSRGEAALSTDGRYFLQAEKQLDSRFWRLLKQGMKGYPSWTEFALTKAAESKFSSVI